MQFLRAVSHSVRANSNKLCGAPSQTVTVTPRLMKNNLTLTPAQTPSSRPSPHQTATWTTAMYTSWLYRVCDMLPPAFLWGLRKRRGRRETSGTWISHLPHRHPNDPVSFLTFSWDMLTVHLQVDLDEFGVADFVPTSTRFCTLSVCYCIILLAGCFLRTSLVTARQHSLLCRALY